MAIEHRKVGDRVYVYEYKSMRVDGKPKRIFQRYHGVLGKDGKITKPNRLVDRVKLSRSKLYGDIAILWKLGEELGIRDVLDDIFRRKREESLGTLATIYAINRATNPTSLNRLPRWYFRTALDELTGVPANHLTKDRMLSVLFNLGHDELIWSVEKALFDRNRPEVKEGLLYDVTSTYFCGNKCILAELGYSRDTKGKNKKQLNLALVTNLRGHPIFHMVYRGGIMDARTGGKLLDLLKSFGIKKITLICDRGISTLTNLKWTREESFHMIGGFRKNSLEFKKLVKLNEDLERPEHFVGFTNSGSGALYAKSYPDRVLGKKCNLVLCLDPMTRAQSMAAKNLEMKRSLDGLGSTTEGEGERRQKEEAEKKEEKIKLNEELEENKKRCGKFLLFSTNLKLNTPQVVQTYFARDAIEKVFRTLKQDVEIHPVRYRTVEHVKGSFFISFLAYLLRSAFREKLESKNVGLTIDKAIERMGEVERIKVKVKRDEKTRIINVGEDQEKIIRKLKLKTLFPVEQLVRT